MHVICKLADEMVQFPSFMDYSWIRGYSIMDIRSYGVDMQFHGCGGLTIL